MSRRILIIEDKTDSLLNVYREWLSLIGYQLQLVNSIAAAEYHLNSYRYHSVIYDIEVAGQHGVEFLRDYWLQFKIEGIRVVVVANDDHLRYECEAMGIPFFIRPVPLRELETIIVGLMKPDARLDLTDMRSVTTRPLPALV